MTRAQDAREWLSKEGVTDRNLSQQKRSGTVCLDGMSIAVSRLMDDFAAARCAQVEAELAQANTPHPFDAMPDSQLDHVHAWLKSNQKKPSDVRWSLYPIGMVGRWIERAEAAESEVTKLKEANRWIPVEEKLPEDGATAEVFLPEGCEPYIQYQTAWIDYDENPPQWVNNGEELQGVTHWRPLPEPPATQSREADNG
jgi:hypothetical protein